MLYLNIKDGVLVVSCEHPPGSQCRLMKEFHSDPIISHEKV